MNIHTISRSVSFVPCCWKYFQLLFTSYFLLYLSLVYHFINLCMRDPQCSFFVVFHLPLPIYGDDVIFSSNILFNGGIRNVRSPPSTLQALDIPLEKLNTCGGAVALGHPLAASGAR
jgi:hypothetical protein